MYKYIDIQYVNRENKYIHTAKYYISYSLLNVHKHLNNNLIISCCVYIYIYQT